MVKCYKLNVNDLSGGNPSARFKRSDGYGGGWMLKAWGRKKISPPVPNGTFGRAVSSKRTENRKPVK